MKRLAVALLALAVPIQACSSRALLPASRAAQSSAEYGGLWAADARALESVLSLANVLLAALVLAALLLLGHLARRLLRFAWRIGIDRNRRMASWLGFLQLGVFLLAAWAALAHLLHAAPAFAFWALALVAGASVLVLGRPLQNASAGLLMRLRWGLREGDRISVGGRSGTVHDVGLLRTELRSEDGSAVLVPNRVVAHEVVAIEPARGTAAVRVKVPLASGPWAEVSERLRRTAIMSPFRVPETPVSVRADEDAAGAWVEVQVWSFDVIRAAERQLLAALLAAPQAAEPTGRAHAAETERNGSG